MNTMLLKCPICGKKYSYDRKICQECENRSIYSGLTPRDESLIQKWNCGIFLESDNFIFGKLKSCISYIQIPSEPKVLNFNTKEIYNWNCNTRGRFNMLKELSLEEKKLLSVSNLKFPKRNLNNSIVYE